ncbi:hypothetical protein ColKHC_10796 [Colletotrichum higginsianum]|nr:hypothetical protein ColKHC_10796 [Colletotrichum higginsianum]
MCEAIVLFPAPPMARNEVLVVFQGHRHPTVTIISQRHDVVKESSDQVLGTAMLMGLNSQVKAGVCMESQRH